MNGASDSRVIEFNVAELMRQATGATAKLAFEAGEIELSAGQRVRLLSGDVRLLRTNRGILASVTVGLAIELECGRCVSSVWERLSFGFEEQYLPVIDLLTGAKPRFDDAEDHFQIDEFHTLDLGEAIRQYAASAEPMAPVCRPDCRGLCSRCGVDRNRESCGCDPLVDDRWAALGAIARGDNTSEDS